VYYKPATAKARATPLTAHPAFPIICDIPAALVLVAAVADDAPKPPVVLAVPAPDGIDVWAAIVDDCTLPVKIVTSDRLIPADVWAKPVSTGRLSVRVTAWN
jgi:hypothetical protein